MQKYFLVVLLLICPFQLLLAETNTKVLAEFQVSSQSACTIAINEIMPNPAGTDTGNEWIELFNCDEIPINVSGWFMKDKSGGRYNFGDVSVEPLGFLLVYPSFSLNQTDEEIFLYNSDQELTDYFTYSTSKEDISYSRAIDGNGEWTDELEPTPGQTNEVIYPGDLRINEIYPTPDGEKDEHEWIEIYNYSASEINLTNWTLSDLTSDETLIDLTVGPDSYIIIEEPGLGLNLNNDGDIITLMNPKGEAVSQFEYFETDTSISSIFYQDTIVQSRQPTPQAENILVELNDYFYNLSSITISAFKQSKPAYTLQALTGTVTAAPGQIYTNKLYVQDETGGILVSFPEGQNFKIGDKLKLCGHYSTYYKEDMLKIIYPECIEKIGEGSVKTFIPASTDNIENYVGQLVKISGEISKNSGTTFWVNDGEKDIKVNIPTSITGIEKSKGDHAVITGIVTRYGDNTDGTANIRLIPRIKSDIQITKPTAQNNVSGSATTRGTKKSQGRLSVISTNTQKTPASKIKLSEPKFTPIDDYYAPQAVKTKNKGKSILFKSISSGGLITSLSSIVLLFMKRG